MNISKRSALTVAKGLPGSSWSATGDPWSSWRVRARRFEGVLASALLAGAAIIWAMPQDHLDQEIAPNVSEKTRPGLSTDPALARSGEVVISAYTGVPYTYPSDVTFKSPGKHDFTAKDVEWIGEPFDNPIYYGVRVARWAATTRSGWMIDFIHSKAIAERDQVLDLDGILDGDSVPEGKTVRQVFDKLEASHGHNMLTFNGLLRLVSLGPRLHPYVGLGAGISLPHSEVHFKGNKKRTYEYQFTGPVGQALFGLEFRTARTSYFLEYKFTYAPYDMPLSERDGTLLIFDLWNQARDWWQGVEPAAGRMTTTFTSHQVVGGLGVRVVPIPVATP